VTTELIGGVLVVVSLGVAVPSAVLFVECIAACFARGNGRPHVVQTEYGSVAVLVPAHNESLGIGPTLDKISAQLRDNDRLIVIADNCTDDTAAVAASHGAEVINRRDELFRGKGFALAHGVDFMRVKPADFVIIVDADCSISPDFISNLAGACADSSRPIQALNLMKSPKGEEQRFAIAEFAWIVRNKVRPLGLSVLGLPCQLQGTGMAFPWPVIQSAELASGNVVEDLELGLNLAQRGYPARFFTGAKVESLFPLTEEGVIKQRQRWEQGALSMLLRKGLRTLVESVVQANGSLFALALDMMVPPLVMHALALVMVTVLVFGCYMLGMAELAAPRIVTLACIAFLAALTTAWIKFGRDTVPVRMWFGLVPYVFSKFRIYRGFAKPKPQEWTRTDRTKEK
jgi:cellulose synthase/poly-beta-1,6-N-acetylglucosamine synthase-like glycosyltransferase